jgi:hypothetical protein
MIDRGKPRLAASPSYSRQHGSICGPPRASVWRSTECDHCSRCSVPHLMAKSIGSLLGRVICMLVSVRTWQVTWVSDCLNVLLRVRNSIIYDTPRYAERDNAVHKQYLNNGLDCALSIRATGKCNLEQWRIMYSLHFSRRHVIWRRLRFKTMKSLLTLVSTSWSVCICITYYSSKA